ncbi:MAG: hypothetical protein CMB80_22140 [Flammeovirgaceae bacterium]|nr:hypothetical protein [Flammeovirgaceae bacterium]MBR06459.1 hypothetical protein [Rickettsiales bacterium]|tara:strand:+ start:1488 stop:1853 length:366 start_codon:yes stop_codon:yes gene_type:complete
MLSFQLSAQVKSIDFEKELTVDKKSEHRHYGEYFKRADNEVEMLYTGAFVFYKSFISSQDGSTCSFTPSCSEYAVQAVKKLGLVKGTISFFDRYTRCNSLSPGFYKLDKNKNRLVDEVGEF